MRANESVVKQHNNRVHPRTCNVDMPAVTTRKPFYAELGGGKATSRDLLALHA